jgi:iron only hydrogenase large subunit-like protein
MEFSGIVKLTDLNDFIRPAENCSVHANMIKKSPNNTAKVSLSDCLACSGCITSAESLLIEQQSLLTLSQKMQENANISVSLSQQTLLALAQTHGISLPSVWGRLVKSLSDKGIGQVLDMCAARDKSLGRDWQKERSRCLAQNVRAGCVMH